MCQPPETKFGLTDPKYRHDNPAKPEYKRNFRDEYFEKNGMDNVSDDVGSKNTESTAESDDVLPELGLKKRNGRGKFAPFAHVVNFMGKNVRRN